MKGGSFMNSTKILKSILIISMVIISCFIIVNIVNDSNKPVPLSYEQPKKVVFKEMVPVVVKDFVQIAPIVNSNEQKLVKESVVTTTVADNVVMKIVADNVVDSKNYGNIIPWYIAMGIQYLKVSSINLKYEILLSMYENELLKFNYTNYFLLKYFLNEVTYEFKSDSFVIYKYGTRSQIREFEDMRLCVSDFMSMCDENNLNNLYSAVKNHVDYCEATTDVMCQNLCDLYVNKVKDYTKINLFRERLVTLKNEFEWYVKDFKQLDVNSEDVEFVNTMYLCMSDLINIVDDVVLAKDKDLKERAAFAVDEADFMYSVLDSMVHEFEIGQNYNDNFLTNGMYVNEMNELIEESIEELYACRIILVNNGAKQEYLEWIDEYLDKYKKLFDRTEAVAWKELVIPNIDGMFNFDDNTFKLKSNSPANVLYRNKLPVTHDFIQNNE